MKPGKELERLVATLERTLAASSAIIEAPSRSLLDRDTGKPREHDVLITWDHGHHQIITAIECRDRARPVGVPDVEAFADKCDATGVHSGVIVSSSGFRQTARMKASARSITCMDLADVDAFDWLAIDHITGFRRQFGHMDVKVMFQENQPAEIAKIFDECGNEVDESRLLSGLSNLVPPAQNSELEVGKENPVKMRALAPGWTAVDSSGAVWPISHFNVTTSFTTIKTTSPIARHRYSGGGRDYSLATAKTPIAGLEGSFVMVQQDDDGETSIYWVPDVPSGSA